jgi:hypothetical protein
MSERLTEMLFEGLRQPAQGNPQRGLVQQSGRDFSSHTREHGAGGIGDSGSPMAGSERGHAGSANQLVDGWKFAKKLRFCRSFHFRIIP